ncbi:MAG: hypothetical protein B7Y90_02410 [Alphaproteobacteria bacterium 32-64-14]|nr:MAG: hypothetical protein B7Y90_02410 [Alphaproteobacteria bacterium 32-64-14]
MDEAPDKPKRDQIILELEAYGDAGMILVGSTMLQHTLHDLLLRFFRSDLTKSDHEGLFNFEKGGPLSSFASCIRIAYALDIIGPETRDDLNTIKSIRNLVAHAPLEIAIDTDPIPDLIYGMRVWGKQISSNPASLRRKLFASAVWAISNRMEMHSPFRYEHVPAPKEPSIPTVPLYKRIGGTHRVSLSNTAGAVRIRTDLETISTRPP